MNGTFDSPQVIWWMIGLCVLFMLFMIFSRQMKALLKVAAQGTVGILAVFLLNFIAAPFGCSVGLNLINAVFIGFLGIPGIATLYIFSAFV